MRLARAGLRLPRACSASEADQAVCGQEGYVCACAARSRRIKGLAQIIAQTQQSPDFPEALRVPGISPVIHYHLPIFVWICQHCGATSDSYSRPMTRPDVVCSPDWLCTAARLPQELQRFLQIEYGNIHLCSEACLHAYNEHRS
ncbi:MAG: hypothetical protein M3Q55_09185 [Acidobacteriota bacterium]|nr:hypothetical protein [Acidobacteriota bacterium]